MKRLIICSDGTWNRPGITDGGQRVFSNVELLFKYVANSDQNEMGKPVVPQLKMYDTGLGSSTFDFSDKIKGGAMGAGIDYKIQNLYRFLVFNYEVGDEIYMFGFSRGAYTVRSLAGFIRNCGILKPEFLHLTDTAYELYRNKHEYSKPDSALMKSFRYRYSLEDVTKIKFMGVWDTVGSLGIPLSVLGKRNSERYKFHDTQLSSTVENAYHAMALDERRKDFNVTKWTQSETALNNQGIQVLEQRWFPGVHCNVGGGYLDRGLSDLALKWIIEKARISGLTFDENKLSEITPEPKGELRRSYRSIYRFKLPIRRLVSLGDAGNEVLDGSIHMRMQAFSNYKPLNLPKREIGFTNTFMEEFQHMLLRG